jgi:hypothetical protein
MDEVKGGWRKLHTEEPRGLHSSPNIIRVVKSRKITSKEHVTRNRETRIAFGVCSRNFNKGVYLKDFDADWRIIELK